MNDALQKANDSIDDYFNSKAEVLEMFGYTTDWVEIPLDDNRGMYWMLTNTEEYGKCVHSPEPFTQATIEAGDVIYSSHIYTQRHLSKWVYRTPTHVLVCIDTHCDGNKFLAIFDADKECTDPAIKALHEEYW